MFITILVWFIMSYGLMTIVVYGAIFEGFRNFLSKWGSSDKPLHNLGLFLTGLTSCPLCFGTWSGFFLSITVYSPSFHLFGTNPMISWFFDGLISAGAVWAINSIIEFFEENRLK